MAISNTGLGDYIHYRRINYMKFGTNRSSRQKDTYNATAAAQVAYQELKAIINKTATKGNVKHLEQFLNATLRQDWSNQIFNQYNIDTTNISTAEAALAKSIKNNIRATSHFDRDTLGVTSLQAFGDKKYRGLSKSSQKRIQKRSLDKENKKVINLLGNLTALCQKGTLSQAEIARCQSDIKKLEIIQHVYQMALEKLGSQSEYASLAFRTANGNLNPLGKILQAGLIIQGAYSHISTQEIGITGEIFGAYTGVIAQGKINQSVDEIVNQMSKAVIGGPANGSVTIYDKISDKYVDKAFLAQTAHWSLDGTKMVTAHTSQDTVDIAMDFDNANNIWGTQHLQASIKNYYDIMNQSGGFQGLGVISQVPLLSLLNLVNTNFGNHYLNLITEDGPQTYSAGLLTPDIENTLKFALAVRGISGARNASFSKLSQYFIVNNRFAGFAQIKIWSTAEVLQRISPAYGVFADQMVDIDGLPRDSSFVNTWQDTAEQRIAKILLQAHKTKLTMSLNTNFFQ